MGRNNVSEEEVLKKLKENFDYAGYFKSELNSEEGTPREASKTALDSPQKVKNIFYPKMNQPYTSNQISELR